MKILRRLFAEQDKVFVVLQTESSEYGSVH